MCSRGVSSTVSPGFRNPRRPNPLLRKHEPLAPPAEVVEESWRFVGGDLPEPEAHPGARPGSWIVSEIRFRSTPSKYSPKHVSRFATLAPRTSRALSVRCLESSAENVRLRQSARSMGVLYQNRGLIAGAFLNLCLAATALRTNETRY